MLSASPPSREAANGEISAMTFTTRRLAVLALALGFSSAHAAPSTADIDRLAIRTLKEFAIPGIAVGVIKEVVKKETGAAKGKGEKKGKK